MANVTLRTIHFAGYFITVLDMQQEAEIDLHQSVKLVGITCQLTLHSMLHLA